MWKPGKFPLTLVPHIAFNDEVWMTAQTLAFSSSDGVTWTRHDKTDCRDKIWIYSGKHTGGADNWGGDLWQMSASASRTA